MRTSPFKPLFTKDLVVDQGEPINAFWGYHLANNYTRLMGLDGTVFFGARDLAAPNPQQLYFDVPVSQFSFHAAPIVQLYTSKIQQHVDGTVFFHGYDWGAVMMTDCEDWDRMVSIKIANQEKQHEQAEAFHNMCEHYVNLGIGIGIKTETNDEVLMCKKFNDGYLTDQTTGEAWYWMQAEVVRGWGWSDPMPQLKGAKVYIAAPDGKMITETVTSYMGTFLSPNSPLVEGILDAEKLRIRWLHDLPGTVYYKIFGA